MQMNHSYDTSQFETLESLLGQIERDYIVSENDKPKILNHLKEYFWLKENAEPSSITAKWSEIGKIPDTLEMKVKQ
jgi:hypothetical protein